MAWQLIYTSAPRLLEAGRTGFGTVARHRAVSGLLATTIERFSQFARLPGHDPRRVVYSHRIVNMANGRFHLLSCLRDAGSDYTGRTNHIAHHLVVEAREVASLLAAGVTPADVLLVMPWLCAWNERPRYLDPSEEVDLALMKARSSHAWEQSTGNKQNARLPGSAAAAKGCYLIIPPGIDERELIRESLRESMPEAWQTTFTTSMEPSDDLADFRWIGLPPASPLRQQAESSTRPVFDLQKPATLPVPTMQPAGKSSPEPVSDDKNQVAPPVRRDSEENAPQIHSTAAAPSDETAAWMPKADDLLQTRTDRNPPRHRVPVWTLFVAGVLLAAASAWLLDKLGQQGHEPAAASLERRIDDLWSKHHLKLEDTREWLRQEASRSESADVLISSYEECLKQIRASLTKPQSAQAITTPVRTLDDFSEMLEAHGDWLRKHALIHVPPDWKIRRPSDLRIMLERWDDEQKCWRRLAENFTKEPPVDQSGQEQLVQLVMHTLEGNAPPAGSPAEWRNLLAHLGETQRPEWLPEWSKLESHGNTLSAEGLQAMMKRVTRQRHVPEWLKVRISQKLQAAAKIGAKEKTGSEAKPAVTVMPAALPDASPDAADASHPVYILTVKDGEAIAGELAKLPELPVKPVMTLLLGGVVSHAQDMGEKWKLIGNAYRQSIRSDESIAFNGGRITHMPERLDGCRLVAHSEDGRRVLFDLRIITRNSKTQGLLLDFDSIPVLQTAFTDNGVNLTMLVGIIRRLQWIDMPTPQFQLRFEGKDGTASEQKLYFVKVAKEDDHVTLFSGAATDFTAVEIRRLMMAEAELLEGIKKDREFIRNMNPRISGREKKEAELRASISEKEIKLTGVAGEIEALQRRAMPVGILPAGTYTLLEMTGALRNICKINIMRGARMPASGKGNP